MREIELSAVIQRHVKGYAGSKVLQSFETVGFECFPDTPDFGQKRALFRKKERTRRELKRLEHKALRLYDNS